MSTADALQELATNLRADVMWASQAIGRNVFLWVNNTSLSAIQPAR